MEEINEEKIERLVQLVEEKKFNELKKLLESINAADFPSLFDEIEDDKTIIIIYRLLTKEKAAEVFAELDSDIQEKLINMFSERELKCIIDQLFMDDTVDLIDEMPSNVVKRILKNIKLEDRKTINELLNYPEDSAGSIMTTEFIDLKENMTVRQALDKIKKIGLKKETIYNCYVLNTYRKITGVVNLKTLVIEDDDVIIKDIMTVNVITVSTFEDQENVAKMFDKYNFLALPVVDKEERLVGIITIDDAMDVMQEEVSEDFEKMAAMQPNENTYFKTSVWQHSRNRILWLLILMFTSIVTGSVIENYQATISTLPLLVAFIPLLMDTGGNCGSQASTLIIRGLATDEISTKDVLKALWKEFRVGIIVGIILAVANAIRIVIQYQDWKIAITVGATLICTVIISKLLGCLLPMAAKKLKLDPAIMASPLITTVVDTVSVVIFFSFSTMIFNL